MLHVADRPRQAKSTRWLRQGRTLLVASTGGHLSELHRLLQRFTPALPDVHWATFDTDQARHLLAGQDVTFVPFVKPRDARATLATRAAAAALLTPGRFSRVISTGAAVAIPFMARARSMGMAVHYIESAARSERPSLSGTIAARIPGVRLYGQYPMWTCGRWQFRGSVFDGFAPENRSAAVPVDKVVVCFGTQRDFGFRRAAERLVRLLPEVCTPSPTVLWQTGATDVTGLGIAGAETVPAAELEQAVAQADLVVCHAGVGSALQALEYGKCPVLLPRRREHGEHADNHQLLIAAELTRRGLAVGTDVAHVTPIDLLRATTMAASGVASPPPFLLQPD